MIPLTLIGLLIMSGIIGVGIWAILNNISFKKTTERYRYVKAKDEDGNEITKVIDLQDKDQ